ncbi:MAG: hypothetical protein IAE78_25885 [Myxococcus sp.]|nr:hypothetical protein [Myxococcus sp.]
MIKKTAAAAMILTLATAVPTRAEEPDHLFSEYGSQKRFSLNVIGVGGALTAVGGVFFFVGRSGAGLHVNPDGSLRPQGLLEEAAAATSLQRVSLVVLAVGLATAVTGAVLLLSARKKSLTVAPTVHPGGAGVMLSGAFD